MNGKYEVPGTRSSYRLGAGGIIYYSYSGYASLKETRMMFRRAV